MRIVSILVTGLMVSGLAYAGDVSYEIDNTAYSYRSDSAKAGDADAVKTTTIESWSDDSTQIKVQWDKLNLYVYPNFIYGNNTPIKVGFDVMPALEAGIYFGYASEKVDDADAATATAFGLYGLYSMPMLEAELGLMQVAKNAPGSFDHDNDPTTAALDYKDSTFTIMLSVDYLHNIAGGFSYMPGFSYTTATQKIDDVDDANVMTSLSLNLIGFRMAF